MTWLELILLALNTCLLILWLWARMDLRCYREDCGNQREALNRCLEHAARDREARYAMQRKLNEAHTQLGKLLKD